jgi:hypothetical protein
MSERAAADHQPAELDCVLQNVELRCDVMRTIDFMQSNLDVRVRLMQIRGYPTQHNEFIPAPPISLSNAETNRGHIRGARGLTILHHSASHMGLTGHVRCLWVGQVISAL